LTCDKTFGPFPAKRDTAVDDKFVASDESRFVTGGSFSEIGARNREVFFTPDSVAKVFWG
jgi:hypothetical protein